MGCDRRRPAAVTSRCPFKSQKPRRSAMRRDDGARGTGGSHRTVIGSSNQTTGIDRSECMPDSDRRPPIDIHFSACRAFEIRPNIGLAAEVEVGTDGILEPSVLAVDLNRARGAARRRGRELAVAHEFVRNAEAGVNAALGLRAVQARGHAELADHRVVVVDGEGVAVGTVRLTAHARIGELDGRFGEEASVTSKRQPNSPESENIIWS